MEQKARGLTIAVTFARDAPCDVEYKAVIVAKDGTHMDEVAALSIKRKSTQLDDVSGYISDNSKTCYFQRGTGSDPSVPERLSLDVRGAMENVPSKESSVGSQGTRAKEKHPGM